MANESEGGGAAAGNEGGSAAGPASAADLIGGAAGGGEQGGSANGQGGGGDAAAAGAGGDNGQGGGDIAGGADPDWYAQLSAEADGEAPSLRDWVKSTGFKEISQLAKAARDTKTALRDSGRVKVPAEGAPETEVAAFRKAIGVPEDPKGYTFTPPQDAQGNDIPLDQKVLGRIAEAGVKHGVPKAALEAVVNDFVKGQLDDIADQDAKQGKDVEAKLKSWGTERAAKEAAMNNALKALNLGRDEALAIRGALGVDKTLDLFVRLGEGMAEDKLITGGSNKFGVSPAAAKAEYDQLKMDPAWVKQARTKGTPENARYERLTAAMGEAAEREDEDA